jgi:hypothetical protein
VTRVVVARDLRTTRLELGPVEHRAVAHVGPASLDRHVVRLVDDGHPVLQGEDLAAPAVDYRHGPGCARCERIEGRDAGDGRAEREREGARRHEPDPEARVAPGPRADRNRVDRIGLEPCLGDERLRVLEHPYRL